jgi:hypothetical protein
MADLDEVIDRLGALVEEAAEVLEEKHPRRIDTL